MATDFLGERQSIHVRQLQVQNRGVEGPVLGQGAQRFVAVAGGYGAQTPLLRPLRDNPLIGEVVFDDEQALAGKLGLRQLPGRWTVSGGGAGQESKMEGSAFAGITLDPDL